MLLNACRKSALLLLAAAAQLHHATFAMPLQRHPWSTHTCALVHTSIHWLHKPEQLLPCCTAWNSPAAARAPQEHTYARAHIDTSTYRLHTRTHTHTWAAAELLLHARSPDTTGTAPLLAPAAAAAAPRARWRPKLDEGAAMRVAVTASPALSTACTGARPVKNLWACGLRVRVPVLLKVLSPALHARAPGQCGP